MNWSDVKPTGALMSVLHERKEQVKRWGPPAHDDEHTNRDWIAFIIKFAGIAADYKRPERWRYAMVRIAALAIAAVESYDRKEKHSAHHPT